MEALIRLDKRPDGVAVLTLNRPERLNAFNREMISQWHTALLDAFSDAAVRVIVLTGAGRGFCAGGDLDDDLEGMHQLDGMSRKNYLWQNVHRIARTMESGDKPVIAAVNGTARGAGMDMALMCDIRYAAQSASFAESYINFGLIAGDGGTYYLPKIVGTARALELFWTGRAVDAEEAQRIGLVSAVVPDDELLATVDALATRIARQPADAVRMYKRIVSQSRHLALETHLDLVSSHMGLLEDTPEHRQLVEDFLAKRKARAVHRPDR